MKMEEWQLRLIHKRVSFGLAPGFCNEPFKAKDKLKMLTGKELFWRRAGRSLSLSVISEPDPGVDRTVHNQHSNAQKNLQLPGKS